MQACRARQSQAIGTRRWRLGKSMLAGKRANGQASGHSGAGQGCRARQLVHSRGGAGGDAAKRAPKASSSLL